ncbi:MAG: flagellar protein FlaG [Pseudomonadota bacterium]
MEIRGITPFPGPTLSNDPSSRPGAAGGAASPEAVSAQRRAVATPDSADAVTSAAEIEMPKLPFTRAEISVDRASKHYYARIVDRDSGKMLAEYPSKALLTLFAVTREQLGKIFKEEA